MVHLSAGPTSPLASLVRLTDFGLIFNLKSGSGSRVIRSAHPVSGEMSSRAVMKCFGMRIIEVRRYYLCVGTTCLKADGPRFTRV